MTLVFRNYVPRNADLKRHLIRSDGVPSKDAEVLLNEAKKKARTIPSEDKPVLVAPKRANWDLKRDVDKMMKKLAKKTQRAIGELAEELNRANEQEQEG